MVLPKGGIIILSIKDMLNIPVKFIGLGEKIDDLQEFDLEQYIYGLCNDQWSKMMDEELKRKNKSSS